MMRVHYHIGNFSSGAHLEAATPDGQKGGQIIYQCFIAIGMESHPGGIDAHRDYRSLGDSGGRD